MVADARVQKRAPPPLAPPLEWEPNYWFNDIPRVQAPPPDEGEDESSSKTEGVKPEVEFDWVNLTEDLGLDDA